MYGDISKKESADGLIEENGKKPRSREVDGGGIGTLKAAGTFVSSRKGIVFLVVSGVCTRFT
jgi:hypothetical protein